MQPGDLRLGQVVMERVAVVKLGVMAMVEAVLLSKYGQMHEDEYGNSEIWRQMRSGRLCRCCTCSCRDTTRAWLSRHRPLLQ